MGHITRIPYALSSTMRRWRGFSLVEILVALVISLFLIAGVIQLFVGSKRTYRFHDGLARIQENGRFALEAMSRDIRMAGYNGCALPGVSIANTLNTPTAYLYNFGQPIQGFESTAANTWVPALDASITSPLATGNADVITVRGIDGPSATVVAHAGGAADPRISTADAVGACDVVLATNCRAVTIFQVTGIAAGAATAAPVAPAGWDLAHATGTATCAPGNASTDLVGPLSNGEVARLATKSYFLRTGLSGRPGLWRRVGNTAAQELVEGVERMQIRYGVCTGADASRRVEPPYVAANAVVNWNNVCSVRIDLLLASLENDLVTNPQTVVFPADTGTLVASNDRRLRQSFSATVGIRNRLP